MISISEQAIQKIIEMKKMYDSDVFLKIDVKSGGCSGFTYMIGFDKKKGENDNIVDINGMKVLLNKEYESYLKDIVVDFIQTESAEGFNIYNPNATSTCGCGNSFSCS
ncbi:HesB/IscA family protein [Chengkuizengella axinellae]|uniref:Iron-sulfur cluster assembly accessory protein n=1 Tax=Chengkuizengella axinellae TaxID=3064388 RepID=A0ABT9J664_9BACL|nr:iron-sulfur cluster assembly accessory protein [Chengkuizengella sp. 2205SS18-9]MDP5277116.1 iron-sulfur cluster assembly accessory protein [Chengkuizengella sp. 2205SS18-9]